ncbi:NAD(P)-binding protein, partial [Rhizopogon vinicolor AM-OR11-026]
QSTPRVWLITGSSSSFGRAMVEEALSNGDIMVATLRKPSVLDDLATKHSPTQPLVIELDVTNEDQVKHVFGRIHVVYNNAFQMFLQELEATSIERARALMDANFWGAVAVSFATVRFFREENPNGLGECSCKY